jgi:GntR family transcriptional regulator
MHLLLAPPPVKTARPLSTEAVAPRYRVLADELRATIEGGALRDNDALPSERELSERHDVSRDTVRKAVRFLEERGVLYSDPGRGTFVAPAMVRNMSRFIDGFSQDTIDRGGKPDQRILLLETQPAALHLAGLLRVEPGRPLTRLKRLRLIDGAVVGLHDAWFVLPKDATLSGTEVRQAQSLYRLLQQKFGFAPAEAIENLNACAADNEEAELLGVRPGSPLLGCERVTFSERREPVEYCLMKYVPSYRYSTRISRHSGNGPMGTAR